MYQIIFSKKAETSFKKLPRPVQIRIKAALRRIEIRPFSYVKKLVGFYYFRLRVGDYRVILDICNNKLKILIIQIGLRKKIYKKLNK